MALWDLDNSHPASTFDIDLFVQEGFSADDALDEHSIFVESLLDTVSSSTIQKSREHLRGFLMSVVKS